MGHEHDRTSMTSFNDNVEHSAQRIDPDRIYVHEAGPDTGTGSYIGAAHGNIRTQ